MQNHPDQVKKTGTDGEKPLQKWVILILSVAVLVIIIFVAFVGLKLLGSPRAEPTATSAQEMGELPPNLQATATAGCALFMQQFPGTPCPKVEPQSIVETATAACQIFQSQFPGTPCP